MSEDKIMSVEEAADFLKVSTQFLYIKKHEGKIPHRKIGGRLVFLQSELYEWVKSGASANK